MERGVPIRSISRCMQVIQAINRHGSLTLMEIAQAAKVPYPTACRIVQTLLHEGFIEREPDRKRYRPTVLVLSLANGFQAHDRLIQASRRYIVDLTHKHNWPLSVVTRVGQSMVVRDSTHALTSRTFSNYYPGFTLPILECASGRAYVAHAPAEERANILEGVKAIPGATDPQTLTLFASDIIIGEIQRDGYATKGRNFHNATPGRTASIAVPLFDQDELIGALTMVFFASAMKMSEAVELYVPEMKVAAERISQDLAAGMHRIAA